MHPAAHSPKMHALPALSTVSIFLLWAGLGLQEMAWRSGLGAAPLVLEIFGLSLLGGLLWARSLKRVHKPSRSFAGSLQICAYGLALWVNALALQRCGAILLWGRNSIPAEAWPTSTLLLMALTSIVVACSNHTRRKQSQIVFALAAAAVISCLGLSFNVLFNVLLRQADLEDVMSALTIACYLGLNGWAVSQSAFATPLLELFVGEDLGSHVGRRLLGVGTLFLLGIGSLRVALQRQDLVTTEEGTALYACCVFGFLLLSAYQHAATIRSEILARRASESALANAIVARDAALRQAHKKSALLNNVLQSAREYAVIVFDAGGTVTLFNEGAERLLGYSALEVEGRMNVQHFHDPNEIAARAAVLGTPANFDVFRVLPSLNLCDKREWTFLCKDGRRVPISLAVSQLDGLPDTAEGYVGIARDLTQDKKLQRDRDGYFSVGQELLCISDTDGVLRSVNPAFTRMLGYTQSDLMGHKFMSMVHPDDVKSTESIMRDIMDGLAIHRFVNRWRAKDRRYHYISWEASHVFDDGLFYASGWDITEQKLIAREKERHLEFQQQLLGIVSHDLRNPVAAIALTAEALIRRKDINPACVRPLQRICNSAQRAERLIFDLLDFTQARLGSGLRIEPSELNMAEVVARCIEDVKTVHCGRSVRLVQEGSAPVQADGGRMGQVLANLLGNALKYSPPNTPVSVSLHQQPSQCTLSVHNEGEPISPGHLATIFEPLKRGRSGGQEQRNIGLGLYIVKEIVRAHGGTIEVHSDLLEGTTFVMTLPQHED